MSRVLIGGKFDPFHGGHVAYVKAAVDLGDVTAAVSDREIPLVPFHDRAEILLGLGVRDVIQNPQPDCSALLASLKPIYYAKGQDWKGRLPAAELDVCKREGINVVFTLTARASSSSLLDCYQTRLNHRRLYAFEQFVQHQPEPQPWTPVTDYSWEARKAIEGPHAQLIKDTFQPTKVLDVGCGPGVLLKMLRAIDPDVLLTGFDKNVAYVESRSRDIVAHVDISDNVQYADDAAWGLAGWFGNGWYHHWDLVICREVLEHLKVADVAKAVRNMVSLSSKFVYVTTRFTAASHLLDVDGADALDPTHCTLLNQDYLRSLFVLEGCTRCPEHEAALDWKHLGRVLVYQVPA